MRKSIKNRKWNILRKTYFLLFTLKTVPMSYKIYFCLSIFFPFGIKKKCECHSKVLKIIAKPIGFKVLKMSTTYISYLCWLIWEEKSGSSLRAFSETRANKGLDPIKRPPRRTFSSQAQFSQADNCSVISMFKYISKIKRFRQNRCIKKQNFIIVLKNYKFLSFIQWKLSYIFMIF